MFVMLELISEVVSLACVGVKIESKCMLDCRKLRHKFIKGMEEPIRISFENGS